ncbi:glycoside hydrolase domain-containing protein [Abyssalbus ytuae]|uniref:Glycoside hydrolase family 92 protein n=1 Tax=Abyssalbus ytuae TaxID=2926907 RepID=A0A9E6ZT97_9FLAO|nr:glycoside hydrolase domain-containing protein [Abyssalbus ytuae]UOB18453.1 glycoside hydrolase family 92 protein [Abyssalbus ytuae]
MYVLNSENNKPKKESSFNTKVFFLLLMLVVFSCKPLEKGKEEAVNASERVNVFLGTSGDHGQMSPSASYPFSMMSIGPQTNPHIHTGYEYYAKEFLGFTHTRIEGVGCTGSGGNILIKPFSGQNPDTKLIKKKQHGKPGNYRVEFENGIIADMVAGANYGIHHFYFPKTSNGLYLDLAFALSGRFKNEEHQVTGNIIKGWIDTETTCSRGIYRIYFAIRFPQDYQIEKKEVHQYLINGNSSNVLVEIAFSSVNEEYALQRILENESRDLFVETQREWNKTLGRVKVEGEQDRIDLFYSLLYRGLQSPYSISEKNGSYRAIDGSLQHANNTVYNGWAIWDNYREQLPMLSLLYPEKYKNIVWSIANMYKYGKQEWATRHEPSPTVRTEHAMVVLLDAVKKGYDVNLKEIKDKLVEEANSLKYDSPDKALETSYDKWAMSEILRFIGEKNLADVYLSEAKKYKEHWKKDFADLSRGDVDRMQARGLYQGTIWQYRWFVPFDIEGLKQLTGGEEKFTEQLDLFFAEHNYNHANQPDLQVPGLYNATSQPWKSQKLFRQILLDTMVQAYFNNNSKGIDPYIGRIYQNKPKAYLRTMDDDAGTMSSWFVMRSMGLSPVNVGTPTYYITAPIFKKVEINWTHKEKFVIQVKNYHPHHYYIKSVWLNGKELKRNWLTHKEISNGGEMIIETSAQPDKNWGKQNSFATKID